MSAPIWLDENNEGKRNQNGFLKVYFHFYDTHSMGVAKFSHEVGCRNKHVCLYAGVSV